MHPLRQTWAGLGLDAKSLTIHTKIPSGLELKQAELKDSVIAFVKPMIRPIYSLNCYHNKRKGACITLLVKFVM